MSNNSLLYLPVSLGEAIDKLSILDIKYEKIADNNRKSDVKNEYDLLYDKLKEFIIKYDNLYQTMKKVNLLIWDMMDILRDGNANEEEYLKTCKECIEFNDIRFRVKNKINYVSESFLKEQKSYKINRLIIAIEKEKIDNVTLLNLIKYFSFIYDEIIIESSFSLTYLTDYFNYDNTILFKTNLNVQPVNNDYKRKIIIEDKEYTDDDLYKLFNINCTELNKII
jgi:hypothetical protein